MNAYLIANYDIFDQEQYAAYLDAAVPTIASHGGEILVAGTDAKPVEGEPRAATVVVRFPSMESLERWYDSAEYQRIVGLRRDNTEGHLLFAGQVADGA